MYDTPEGVEDVYVDKYIQWISSKDKVAVKILNRKSKMVAKAAKKQATMVDPVAMRSERILTLFSVLDKSGRGVIRVEDFADLGVSIDVQISAAEMSRSSVKLDPEESGEISFEDYESWMMDPENETARKLFQPEVVQLFEREAAEANAAAAELAGKSGSTAEPADGNETSAEVIQTGDLTENEAKALFAMLDDDVKNELSHADMMNMGEAIGFSLSESSVEQAMLEIGKFPRGATEEVEDDEAKAERLQKMRQQEEDNAKTLVFEQDDAWILMTNKELKDGRAASELAGQLIRWKHKDGSFVVGRIEHINAGKAQLQTQLEELAEGSKPKKPIKVKLDRKLSVGRLDVEWAEKWKVEYVEDYLKNHEAEALAAKTKKKAGFEYRYRARVEDDARQAASVNDAAWMDASHLRPEKLVGQWIHILDKDMKGVVTGYQELVGLHTIKFENVGEKTIKLDGSEEFKVMSEKFVSLFIERVIREWEAERKKERQLMRDKARIAALEQPDAWIPGNGSDLNELKGETIDVRGKGKGVVKSAQQNTLNVVFDKDVQEAQQQAYDSTPEPEIVDPSKLRPNPLFATFFRPLPC